MTKIDQMLVEEDIENLCHKYSELSQKEIEYIIEYAQNLDLDDEYDSYDIFIDTWNPLVNEALVVWHRKPVMGESLYQESVIGKTAYRKDELGPVRTLLTGSPSISLMAISQEGLKIKQTSYPIMKSEKIVAVLIFETKLADDLQVNVSGTTKSRDTQVKKDYFLDQLNDIIMIFDDKGNLIKYNSSAVELYEKIGYLNPIEGLTFDDLSLGLTGLDEYKKLEPRQVKEENISFWKFCIEKKIYRDEDGNYVQILKDITDQKEFENTVKNELVNVQEIHHRVKNNLQMVVSLLRLQARRTESQGAKKALNESINRILSIATTHDLLSTKNENSINLKEVIDAVFSNLMYSTSSENNVTLYKEIDSQIELDSGLATTVALIMNEIIMNSMEHAFVGLEHTKDFEIRVYVKEENGLIQIKVTDNGRGFEYNDKSVYNLGLQLVTSFVESKLNGLIVFESNNPGTLIRIHFDKNITK